MDSISEFRSNLAPPFDLASAELGGLLASQVKGAAEAYQAAESTSRRLTTVGLVTGGLGLATAIGLCGWLARSILRPLREVSAQARMIREGRIRAWARSTDGKELSLHGPSSTGAGLSKGEAQAPVSRSRARPTTAMAALDSWGPMPSAPVIGVPPAR